MAKDVELMYMAAAKPRGWVRTPHGYRRRCELQEVTCSGVLEAVKQ